MYTFKIIKAIDIGVANGEDLPNSLFQMTGLNALKDFRGVMGGICLCRLTDIALPPTSIYVFFVIEVAFESKASFNKLKLRQDKRGRYLSTLNDNYQHLLGSELLNKTIPVGDGGVFA